jgi:signal transduction histidine kinase
VIAMIGIAVGTAGFTAVLGGGVLWLLRGRSITTAVTATVLIAVLAVAGGVLAAARSMFISPDELGVLIIIVAAAGVTGSGCAALLGHRVTRLITGQAAAVAEHERERALEAGRRELVASLSHDLRTPLAGIRAMAEALEDEVVADAASMARYHRGIRTETERLASMVDDLFELSRLHAGTTRFVIDRVALADIVEQVITTADPLARAAGVRLGAEVADTPIDVDASAICRCLENLLANAIRHTPAGGTVTLTAGRDHETGYLAVEDSCGGIEEGDLPRVFEIGFRGGPARAPEGSAGLGLAIARGLVTAHRGDIDVANTLTGCRFTVHLPLRAPRTPQPAPTTTAAIEPETTPTVS